MSPHLAPRQPSYFTAAEAAHALEAGGFHWPGVVEDSSERVHAGRTVIDAGITMRLLELGGRSARIVGILQGFARLLPTVPSHIEAFHIWVAVLATGDVRVLLTDAQLTVGESLDKQLVIACEDLFPGLCKVVDALETIAGSRGALPC